MKRLIRKSEKMVYKFKSPLVVYISDEFSWKGDKSDLDNYREYKDDANDAIQSSIRECGDRGLAQYLEGQYDDLAEAVESITLSIDGIDLLSTVTCNRELTSDDKKKIMSYLEGQFADGWGEGFEQYVIGTYNETEEYEEYDEEEGETYTEYQEVEREVRVAPWTSLFTIKEV